MSIDFSSLSPYLSIAGTVLLIIIAFVIIRFFWQHLLKYLVQGCLAIIGIILLVAILKYFKVF